MIRFQIFFPAQNNPTYQHCQNSTVDGGRGRTAIGQNGRRCRISPDHRTDQNQRNDTNKFFHQKKDY